MLLKINKLLLISTILLGITSAKSAFGLTTSVGSFGLSLTSFATGVVGVGFGVFDTDRSAGNRLAIGGGGTVIALVDPEAATFLSGKSVISYPDSLLEVNSITWFGNFAEDSSLPIPPVEPTGFIETEGTYQLQQPNPILDVSTSNSNGILTIEWDASSSGGILVESEGSFNFMGILFQNITDRELVLTQAESSPNFFQIPSQQRIICIPQDETIPVTCGSDVQKIDYKVAIVPEPSTILGLSFIASLGFIKLLNKNCR